MKWNDLNILPEDDKKVLVYVEGYLPNSYDLLNQRTSFEIFVGKFNRSTGWKIFFCPVDVKVKYWSDIIFPMFNDNKGQDFSA